MTQYDSDLLFLLHDVARLLRTDADRRAREHGMTRAQWAILVRLDHRPGLSQKELAELLEVEPITVARLVDRLEARGMVERRPDQRDRRIWRLHLLPPATPVLDYIAAQRQEMLAIVGRDVEPAIVDAMVTGLRRMKATLCSERRAETRDVA